MKKITIELDDRYADAIGITVIGHGDGYQQNITNTLVNLQYHNHVSLVCLEDDVTRPEWKEA